MSKVGSWSTTPGSNNSTPPDGWPEGQAPSTVNDCAREMMAQIKVMVNSLEYIDLNNTPSFLTATTFSMATADVTNFEVGRRVKLFDTNTLYGTVISVSATQVQVRLDYHTAQSALTTSLSSIAMAIIRASNNSLPNNVWRHKNFIINGNMDIWQRSATFTAVATATYTADRFAIYGSNGGSINVTRSERSANASNVPSLAQSGAFFNNALLVSVSAVDAAIAAGDYQTIEYRVEGYDWRQIAHRPMNLSFYVSTNKSGIYAISMANGGSSASYVQNFTISAVNTWAKFSIPIPEAPTTVTWDYSSGVGLIVRWALTAGTTFQGGAGNWTATNILATASQVNFLASAGNTFAITGIQLEEGTTATPFEIRPYLQELQMCKRYYQELSAGERCFGYAISTSRAIFGFSLEIDMRSAPTVTPPAVTGLTISDGAGTDRSVSAFTTLGIGTKLIEFDVAPVGTPLTAGQGAMFFGSVGAANKTTFNAEL